MQNRKRQRKRPRIKMTLVAAKNLKKQVQTECVRALKKKTAPRDSRRNPHNRSDPGLQARLEAHGAPYQRKLPPLAGT